MATCESYVICTAPRSGSTLLCNLLSATGVAGSPGSHFHEPSLAAWLDCFDLVADPAVPERKALAAVFKAAIAKGSAGTGMFGLRLQRHSFDFFMEQLRLLHPGHTTDVDRLQAAFGRTRIIHLSRRDKVDQAISYVKAEQSGLWHVAPDGTEVERLSPPADPTFDADAIRARVNEMTEMDRQWEDWFTTEGITPLRLSYDDLSADPAGTLRGVLAALGLDPMAAEGVTPGVAKLADATSRDWKARFHETQKQG